ncbi:MAG TPA: hypothetical protein VKE24_11300 [Candidatus Acidoferrales bacterium]|nr:hypothetical protein [Candidatus Acidoferrales bacterium]
MHGVQREIPIEASEGAGPVASRAQPQPARPSPDPMPQRLGKRLPLRVLVLVSSAPGRNDAFQEECSTLLVNAGGGLIALSTAVELGERLRVINKATREEETCRVAYVGPLVGGRARVGVAFHCPLPDFWKTHQPEHRIQKAVRVWIRGEDLRGNPFTQSARTVDISRQGARLDGVGYLTQPGKIIEVRRLWHKALYRVVWTGQIGTPEANQIGISSVEPTKNIWGVPLPNSLGTGTRPAATPSLVLAEEDPRCEQAAEERRSPLQSPPSVSNVLVAVRWVNREGASQEEKATARVVSERGCVVPMRAALVEGETLELVNHSNGRISTAKVIWCGAIDRDGRQQVAIELDRSDPQFWSAA